MREARSARARDKMIRYDDDDYYYGKERGVLWFGRGSEWGHPENTKHLIFGLFDMKQLHFR